MEKAIQFWETSHGDMAAFLVPENPGEATFNIHPQYDTAELLEEMFSVALTQYGQMQDDNSYKLTTWIPENDLFASK